MPEIEFVETGPPVVLGTGHEVSARRMWPAPWRLAPSLLALAAAVLALIAPFHTVTRVTAAGSDLNQFDAAFGAVDGWGRRHFAGPGSVSPSEHGIRYGIVLACIAGLLVIGALLFARAAVRRPAGGPTLPIARAIAIAAAAGSLAISATQYLDYLANKDEITPLRADGARFTVHLGPCCWLAIAAGLVGLVAVASSALAARFLSTVEEHIAGEGDADGNTRNESTLE